MYDYEKKEQMEVLKLQEALERQYGPAVAQDIIDQIQKVKMAHKTPDYMDVKAMSELQERYRAQAMMAVWRLKAWRKGAALRVYPQNIIALEGAYLERQCIEAIGLYRTAHKGYFAMYREAMAAYEPQQNSKVRA